MPDRQGGNREWQLRRREEVRFVEHCREGRSLLRIGKAQDDGHQAVHSEE